MKKVLIYLMTMITTCIGYGVIAYGIHQGLTYWLDYFLVKIAVQIIDFVVLIGVLVMISIYNSILISAIELYVREHYSKK